VSFPQPSYAEPVADTEQPQRVVFHASGGEYFRIWIVNLLLTIVTLGIYSAWAKVRRNQYFYSSTELAGSSFEYHGNPVAILKGRIVAVLVFGAYTAAGQFSPLAGVVMALVMAGLAPWFIWKSLQFRLHNTSYRGIRFRFDGDVHDAYKNYLARPMLNGLTLFLATPFVHQRVKTYQHNESRYGNARFSFDASVGSFYKLYAICAAVVLAGLVLTGWLVFSGGAAPDGVQGAADARAGETALLVLLGYAWIFLVYPLFMNMLQNLIWNHTSLEQHRFQSDMKWGRVIFITVTNYLAIICTVGLFIPFAKVRALRYRLESTVLLPQGSLDEFVADNAPAVGAAGEGLADVMDFDLSI
jgi:uncharacterized membrane protein YjgN (DUF898 family)